MTKGCLCKVDIPFRSIVQALGKLFPKVRIVHHSRELSCENIKKLPDSFRVPDPFRIPIFVKSEKGVIRRYVLGVDMRFVRIG